MGVIKLPDSIQTLYVCGDIHQHYELIKYHITNKHLKDCCIIGLGDIGLGFNLKYDAKMFPFINKKLSLSNCYWITFAGNHDNPASFRDDSCIMENGKSRNWIKVPNYTIINTCNKNILCVSGAVSIDRQIRTLNKDYWANELPTYQPKVSEKIDIICSHSAPSFCYPNDKGGIVSYYAENDSQLLIDIDIERSTLDRVYEDYKNDITHWYYGHFHKSMYQNIDGIQFRLCNCGELVYHRDKDYYDGL